MHIGPLLQREIESTFTVMKDRSTSTDITIICPECGDTSGNRGISLATGRTFCWRCGKGKHNKGSFTAWAKSLGYTFSASGSSSGIPMDELLYATDTQASAVPVIQEVALPEGFIPIARHPKHIYTSLICDMAERKHLRFADFAEAGVGYTMDDPLWEPFAIFPVYEYNTCVYYQGRTYIDVPGETTKRFPSRSKIKWGASYWVYNIDAVREQQPEIVVIVESILNVLSLRCKFKELGWTRIVPVCVFKHHISQVQVIKLLRCKGVKEFCMLFDHDAIEETWKMVGALNERVAVTVAEMPFRADNKKLDPNDDVDAAIEAIKNRTLYTAATAGGHVLSAATGLASRQVDITKVNLKGGS